MYSIIHKIGNSIIHKTPNLKSNLLYSKCFLEIGATRCYSYYYPGMKKYDSAQSVDHEVSKDPEEWKYVLRVLPSQWIQEPLPKDSYPSGWQPPDPAALVHPYYVRRTKNHMIPVYLKISQRGMRKITIVRYIKGDIWRLYDDLKKYLEEKNSKEIGVKVDEVTSSLQLKGDHFYYTKKWLTEKGF